MEIDLLEVMEQPGIHLSERERLGGERRRKLERLRDFRPLLSGHHRFQASMVGDLPFHLFVISQGLTPLRRECGAIATSVEWSGTEWSGVEWNGVEHQELNVTSKAHFAH